MSDITVVKFPGFGIDWELNRIAFSLFGRPVYWYGILITLGIVLAFAYVMWRGVRNEGVKTDDVIDIGIFTVIFGIIGARLYYVLTTMNDGKHVYESFLDVIAIWEGGIAVYGSIIGGALAIIVVTRIKKINTLKFCDMVVPGLILAQAVGRWGNFFNGEAHGSVIGETSAFDFLGLQVALPVGEGSLFYTLRMWILGTEGWNFYHPTFLYESVWCLAGFVLLTSLYSRKKFHGQILLMYAAWYGFGRMLIEGLRTDSLYIPGTPLRISQCIGLVCFVAGSVLLTVFLIKFRKAPPVSPVRVRAKGGETAQAETEAAPATGRTESLWEKIVLKIGMKKEEEVQNAPSEDVFEESAEEESTECGAEEKNKSEEEDNGTEN